MTVLINPFRFGGAPAPFSPLSITWHAAYWTGGPNFTALALANLAAVSAWPDESGNARDLAQATSADQPVFLSTDASFSNKPVVSFTNDYMTAAAWTAIAQPNEIIMVARIRNRNTGANIAFIDSNNAAGRQMIWSNTGNWSLNAGASVAGGATTTTVGFWDARFDATDTLTVNGTAVVSGAAGANSMSGVTLGASQPLTAKSELDVAFVGIKNGALTTQERTDLRTWAQSTYGTP